MDGVQFLGRFLGLDEAHTIKNHNSRVYAAIRKLRDVFEVALLATGTMLDNTWADVYSLVSLMRDHPFTSMLRMREIFTDGLEQDPRPKNLNVHVPKGVKLERLVRFLHAFTISRPSTTVTKNMEALVQCEICFDLTKEDRERSNAAFALYSQSMHNFEDAAYGGHADGGDGPQILWGEHTKAVQFTFHNSLPSFMGLKRKDEKAQQKIAADIELKDTEIVTTKERQEMEDWPVHIREGENWRSPRIDVIIDIINQSRDRRPGDSILVLDESAQFLMILEVAIEKMVDPVPVFRYTGEQEPAERHVTLTSFVESAATKTSVMLATRGAGGQGLNLQSANVVIRCGPWWKKSWEEQAVARVYRHGQKKPVWSYELKAKGCRVETYRRRVRKGKSTINEAIMALVTIEDDAPLPVWSEQLADEYEHEEFSVVELETADGSKGVRAQKVEGDDNGLIMEEAAFLVPHASGLDAKDLVGAEDMMDDEGTEVKVEKEVDSDYVYEGGDSGDDES
jgi:SNF2 family DNA or RNA helicase